MNKYSSNLTTFILLAWPLIAIKVFNVQSSSIQDTLIIAGVVLIIAFSNSPKQ